MCEILIILMLLVVMIKYKEIMMNDDNLESNLLTSSLLKKMSGLHAGTSLTVYCSVAGDELMIMC